MAAAMAVLISGFESISKLINLVESEVVTNKSACPLKNHESEL